MPSEQSTDKTDQLHRLSTEMEMELWREQAAENVEEWGLQDRETLLLAMQEELGELAQAHLEARHEDGDPERISTELTDLGALCVQLWWRLVESCIQEADVSRRDGGDAAMTIGDETVLRVRSTPKGCKVIEYDGVGLADGIAAKSYRRYFYGDSADEKATEYAERVSEENGYRLVRLGERL